jgi:hypothetical protein
MTNFARSCATRPRVTCKRCSKRDTLPLEVDAVARETGAPIVVLKGGVRAINGEEPVLPVVDLDILIRREDLARVSSAFESHGMGARNGN